MFWAPWPISNPPTQAQVQVFNDHSVAVTRMLNKIRAGMSNTGVVNGKAVAVRSDGFALEPVVISTPTRTQRSPPLPLSEPISSPMTAPRRLPPGHTEWWGCRSLEQLVDRPLVWLRRTRTSCARNAALVYG